MKKTRKKEEEFYVCDLCEREFKPGELVGIVKRDTSAYGVITAFSFKETKMVHMADFHWCKKCLKDLTKSLKKIRLDKVEIIYEDAKIEAVEKR